MPVVGVKRANSELDYQTPVKKSVSPGLWTRFISTVSRLVSYLNQTDSDATTAATAQPAVDDSTVNVMEKQNDDTAIIAPCTRQLFTPVLSELERNEKRGVTTPITVQPSRSPLFSPMFLGSNSKYHESSLTTASSKKPSLSTSISHNLSTDHYSTISRPVLTSSRFVSKDRSVLKDQSTSLDQSRYRSLSTSQSRFMDRSRSRKNRSIITSHSRPQPMSNSSAPTFSMLQTSLLSPTANNHIEKAHVKVTPQHSMPPSSSRSPVEELQQWISEFKDSYHSNRKDLTAQIDAAEKYARLQSDQRNQLCDQRMEQLRKRFDSGLDIKEFLADDHRTTEEQAEVRLQHDGREKTSIQKAFGPGPADEELSCAFRIRLKRRDFQTLYGLHWLNDEVVNFYMNMIADTCNDVHSYSSFFYPKLISNAGYSGVRRWTKKVDIFSKRLLLIPVHLGMHWCLAAVDFNTKQISYYDSFKGHNPECLRAIKQYLVEEAADKKQMVYDTSGWQCVTHKNIPAQENGSDCGVFMCMYARHLARNRPFRFSQDDMPRIREHMVLEMLEQKLI